MHSSFFPTHSDAKSGRHRNSVSQLKTLKLFHTPQNIPEQFLQLNVVHYSTIVPMKVYLWSEGLGG